MAQQCLPFDQIVNYTCSTEATYIGREPDGFGGYNYVMKTAQPNEPRFPYDPETGEKLGLLNEPSSENFAYPSEDLSDPNYARTNMSILSNDKPSPIEGVNSFELQADANGATLQGVAAAISGEIVTTSFYVKPVVLTGTIRLRAGDLNNIDVTDQVEVGKWSRISTSAITSSTTGRHALVLGSAGDIVEAIGVQFEQGYLTSYIKTTTSSAVRDAASSYADFNSSDNFTIFLSVGDFIDGLSLALNRGDGSPVPRIFLSSSTFQVVNDAGSLQINSTPNALTESNQKVCIVKDGGTVTLYRSWGEPTPVNLSGSLSGLSRLGLGQAPWAEPDSRYGNVTIKKSAVLNYAIPPAEAIALTTLEA